MLRLSQFKAISFFRNFNPFQKFQPKSLTSPKTIIVLVFGLVVLILLPWFYQESWLSPFSTLNVPNSLLHPHAFSEIGYIDASDPTHPLFTSNKSQTQELLRDLGYAKPITTYSEDTLNQSKVSRFILHRPSTRFHSAEDFSLQYYPDLELVLFGGQEFHINEASILLLNNLPQQMKSGWWTKA